MKLGVEVCDNERERDELFAASISFRLSAYHIGISVLVRALAFLGEVLGERKILFSLLYRLMMNDTTYQQYRKRMTIQCIA